MNSLGVHPCIGLLLLLLPPETRHTIVKSAFQDCRNPLHLQVPIYIAAINNCCIK